MFTTLSFALSYTRCAAIRYTNKVLQKPEFVAREKDYTIVYPPAGSQLRLL